ncbi:MAG: hypothetical protein R2837_10130 [Aliarcobacter sp.]
MYLNITDVFVINGVIGASGIGIAIGSVIYSRLSKHYIEVGTIPLASFGMAITLFISTVVENPVLIGISFSVWYFWWNVCCSFKCFNSI